MIVRDIHRDGEAFGGNPLSLKKTQEKVGNVFSIATPQFKKDRLESFFVGLKTHLPRKNIFHSSSSVLIAGSLIIILVFNLLYIGRVGLRFKKNIVTAASEGFSKIMDGALHSSKGDFTLGEKIFVEAEETFKDIKDATWFSSGYVENEALKEPLFDSLNAVVNAGSYLSQAGKQFTQITQGLSQVPKLFFKAHSENLTYGKDLPKSLTEEIKKYIPLIQSSAELLEKGGKEISSIPKNLIPKDLQERFEFAQKALSSLVDIVDTLLKDTPAILALLGDNEPHRFLVLLQNNSELRPSGGFIGNYMVIEINDGYLTKNEVVDTYATDHQLAEIIAPPAEILPVNSRWFMRDSNYSGHFPLSANKASWFLEKAGGTGIDTVIALDQDFIKEVIKLTGPIELPGLRKGLSSDNFSIVLSYIVESKFFGRDDPKSILKDFLPSFESALFKKADPLAMSRMLQNAIATKHVLAYSKDPTIQQFFERYNLTGEMIKSNEKEDYLQIVHTSIGGNKSDDYVRENILHDTILQEDGSVINEITLTRTYLWNRDVEKKIAAELKGFGFNVISNKVWEILGRSRNIHMMRIYVPEGSVLEESSQEAVTTNHDKDTGKTYFLARMEVPTGETKVLRLRYRLPFKLNLDPVDKYSLVVQKQAGQKNVNLHKRILPENRVNNYKYFPESGTFDIDGIWHYETPLEQDISLSSIWGVK